MNKQDLPLQTIFLSILGVIAALILALLIIMSALMPSTEDINFLIVFMAGTAIITITVSYILYRQGLARWFRSLRWAILATVVLTVTLVFVNFWITARLMIIEYNDLALTSALLLFAGVTAITFGFFISRTITDSIRDLAKTAEQLAQGDLTARLEVRGNDEIARLSETFNWMASNLQEIDEQKRTIEQTRRNLIAWVSHDLRTPLASMRVMIEALQDGVVTDPETVNRYLENTRAEIAHLSGLITDLFELAQIDVGHVNMTYINASLCDLISDTLGSMTPQALNKKVKLEGKVDQSIDPIEMAPDKIQRVLYNLLDNAIQYTPEMGEIMLKAYTVGQRVRIDVHNTGSSIDPDDIPHIFSSFYRGEPSRMREHDAIASRTKSHTRGAGLGLAITKGFIEAHGGQIWVNANQNDNGITFSFTLPRKQILKPA